jgi:hypothetical protein
MIDASVAIYVALISAGAALLGAAIGQLGPFLQTRTAARTERTKQIVQLAIEDLKVALEQARRTTPPGGTSRVAPLVARLDYYEAALDAIERGRFDDATLQRIRARSREIVEQTSRPAD